MNLSGSYFLVSEEHNCPMYTIGDRFYVSGRIFPLESLQEKNFVTTTVIQMPERKDICRILISDINAVFVKYDNINSLNRLTKNCSGCTGVIRIEYIKPAVLFDKQKKKKSAGVSYDDVYDIGAIASLLYIFPIFQTLTHSDIKELLPLLKIKKFAKGSVVFNKGEQCENLYIIVGGIAEVIKDDICIGVLERGAVFGAISLLTGSSVGVSIRAKEFLTALMVYGDDFQQVLTRFPALQMYLAKLLAERLSETGADRGQTARMVLNGCLSELKPSELFQMLNLNHKTGVLVFMTPECEVTTFFDEGKLIGAEYGEQKGLEAFFAALKITTGRFTFTQGLPPEKQGLNPLGDFMYLLIEGVKMLNNDPQRNL